MVLHNHYVPDDVLRLERLEILANWILSQAKNIWLSTVPVKSLCTHLMFVHNNNKLTNENGSLNSCVGFPNYTVT